MRDHACIEQKQYPPQGEQRRSGTPGPPELIDPPSFSLFPPGCAEGQKHQCQQQTNEQTVETGGGDHDAKQHTIQHQAACGDNMARRGKARQRREQKHGKGKRANEPQGNSPYGKILKQTAALGHAQGFG